MSSGYIRGEDVRLDLDEEGRMDRGATIGKETRVERGRVELISRFFRRLEQPSPPRASRTFLGPFETSSDARQNSCADGDLRKEAQSLCSQVGRESYLFPPCLLPSSVC